jgi:hypothetical protein
MPRQTVHIELERDDLEAIIPALQAGADDALKSAGEAAARNDAATQADCLSGRDFLLAHAAELRAALSSSPEQGGEDGNWYFDAPPDEEQREQIEEAVFQLECAALEATERGEAVAGQRRKIAAAFLRTLASQEQGEGGRIANLEALELGWDSYGGEPPTEQALDRLRGFDRALSYVPISDGGIQVEFHALGLDFEVVIAPDGQVGEYDLEPSSPEHLERPEVPDEAVEAHWQPVTLHRCGGGELIVAGDPPPGEFKQGTTRRYVPATDCPGCGNERVQEDAEGNEIPCSECRPAESILCEIAELVHRYTAAESDAAEERERLKPVIAVARRWLSEEHGSQRPMHPADKGAARLFAALKDLDSLEDRDPRETGTWPDNPSLDSLEDSDG